jgi:hypothetical protein
MNGSDAIPTLSGAKTMTIFPIVPWLQGFAQRLPASRPSVSATEPSTSAARFQPLTQACSALPTWVTTSPLALKYHDLLSPLPWASFPERDLTWPHNAVVTPYAAFMAAFLIQIDQGLPTLSRLRQFLVEHPALVWLCGFPLVPDPSTPWGFDADASLPTCRHFTRILRQMPNSLPQCLLSQSVTCLQQALLGSSADFGQTISLDTKHIIAWVKENNPKTFVSDRFDKSKQPAGDADCRLGCKKRHNQMRTAVQPGAISAQTAHPTPTSEGKPASQVEVGEFYWGYGSGIVVAKVPGLGEIVLAELTQPFDQADVSYFFPLMAQVEARLGRRPRFGALDAAYDAFYIYEYFHAAGGFAAIPWADRPDHKKQFDANGLPLCSAGLAMTRQGAFMQKTHCLVPHECARYACPLLYPQPTGQSCPINHKNWAKPDSERSRRGGCLTTLPTSPGARARHELDRSGAEYKAVYSQRSACERINAQAVELGIERPKLRNGQAIANRNTHIYILLNLRLLRRLRDRTGQPPSPTH